MLPPAELLYTLRAVETPEGITLELRLAGPAPRALTLGRLDPARSFHLPVWQLENLRGGARRRRQQVLNAQQKGAVWLTFTCAHFELIADLGLVALVWLMLPDFVRLDFWDLLEDKTVLQQLWINLVELFGIGLIEPFYVADWVC